MATKTRTTFETRNDLPAESREKLVALLNARLADTFDLYSQIKQAHWSVRGPDFIQLHLLYDTVAEGVLGFVDEIAERAAALGGLATGTVRMAAEASTLDEYPLDATSGPDTVDVVAGWRPTAPRCARPSTRPTRSSATWTPRTCSPRSRARSTSTSGSSRRTTRPTRRTRRGARGC